MSLHSPQTQGDGPRDCGTFFLDVVGNFRRGDVTVQWSDEKPKCIDEVTRLIAQSWELALWEAKKIGQTLFDGPMCRLIAYTVEAALDSGLFARVVVSTDSAGVSGVR